MQLTDAIAVAQEDPDHTFIGRSGTNQSFGFRLGGIGHCALMGVTFPVDGIAYSIPMTLSHEEAHNDDWCCRKVGVSLRDAVGEVCA